MVTSVKTLSRDEIAAALKEMGQPAFRTKQLVEWLYVHHVDSYEQMTNLPAAMRAALAEEYPLFSPTMADLRVSRDGTRKYIFQYEDGCMVETVAIPADASRDRLTVCFSTQVGCPMACGFCATGQEGFTRNLGPGEIIDQVLAAQDNMGERVSNLVAMGQGEPFLNYDNVLEALRILNDPKGIAIGARRITVSTCGIIPGIERFAGEPEQFTLAISLHSAVQETRDVIMPKVRNYPLPMLRKALLDYVEKTNRRVTLEYLLMRDINDTEDDLQALIDFTHGLHCHINFLPMNAVEGSLYQPSTKATVDRWMNTFNRLSVEATLRTSRGSDIDGACGQLKNKLAR